MDSNFFLIAGPCVVEGEEITLHIAHEINKICNDLDIPFYFKASYKKANRSRLDSFTGIGDEKALRILQDVGRRFDIPVVTDIHTAEEAAMAAEYVDILQIPAFLCRQTDLLIAAAKTGKIINIKKGQFLSGASMKFAVEKAALPVKKFAAVNRLLAMNQQDLLLNVVQTAVGKTTATPTLVVLLAPLR